VNILTGTVTLNNLNIINGYTTSGNSSGLTAITSGNGKVVVNNSSFSNCTNTGSSAYGGAIAVSADLDLNNCTISSCTADLGGGAIASLDVTTINILNCTIVNNHSNDQNGGGGMDLYNATAFIKNTILAKNTSGPTNTLVNSLLTSSTLTSSGYNLSDDNGGFTSVAGDLINKNFASEIKINSLANNGGPILTCDLQAGSLAIDAASSATITDARGYGRYHNADIGAYEYHGIPPSLITPVTQASGITFTGVTTTTMSISWTRGSGSSVAVFIHEGTASNAAPVEYETYTANEVFMSGSQIGTSGWYCVYNSTGTSVTVTGLTVGTDYVVQVLEYNGTVSYEKYNMATAANNPKSQRTVGPPVITAISPTDGPIFGGTSVTITGTDLTAATAVKFGATNATGYTVNSATQITATSPVGSGSVDITVTTAGGTSATGSSDQFTYYTAPGAPSIGPATAGNAQASVNFTAPASTGGASITGYTVTSNPGGFTGSGLSSPITVTGLTNGTAYTFTVTATNSAGTGSASAASNSVTPKASQTITFANPGAQNFGTTPTLTATASSGLTPTFTSSTTGVCTITSDGTLTFLATGTCTINVDQAGSNSWSAAPTVTRSFTVVPVVPSEPSIGTATPGDAQASVSFTAPASTGGASITDYTVTSNPGGFTGTGTSSPIIVTGLANGIAYTFTVTATNLAGTGPASAASNSITPTALPTVTTQAVSSVLSTSATGNGNLTSLGSPNPTAYGICWNTTGAPTTSDSNADNGTASVTGAFTASMTGLTAGTTYYVRAFATNSAGTNYGETVNFKTLKVSSVTTQAISSISTYSGIASGNITDLGYPNPTAYGFCWSTTPNPTTANNKIDKGTATAAGTFTATLTGLTPYTTYYVRAYSSNTAGISYGEQVSFSTKGIVAGVTLYEINDIEATSAIGKCSITDLGIPDPTAYGICWSTSSEPTMFNSKIHNIGAATTTGVFDASITGLEPNTVYYARVYAANTEGIAYSEVISFKTTKFNPVISWNNPSDIFYGTALSNTQLNATADVEGTYIYTPAIGTIPEIGNAQNLSVTFTPNDLTKGEIVSKTVQINVIKAIPVITWEKPKDIVHGTALSEIQLNATADVTGTFVYDPAAGTVLNTGDAQTLTVTFTPTDADHYAVTSNTVKINITIGTGTDIKTQSSIYLYPNPVTDVFRINGIVGSADIMVSDINGKLIFTKQVTENEAISVKSLTPGFYMIKICSNSKVYDFKLVKK
jgi:hypothetical protein